MGLIFSQEALALDSNIFIAAYDTENSHYHKSLELINEIFKKKPNIFISVLVFEEFLVKIYKKELEKNLSLYEDFLTGKGTFITIDFTKQTARIAAQIRAKYPSIKTPDAIHLASAIESGAQIFITTDKRLPKKIENLKIKTLK